MTALELLFYPFAAGLLIGCAFGQFGTERRWRRNADEVWRIESGGRLYKVHHDEKEGD